MPAPQQIPRPAGWRPGPAPVWRPDTSLPALLTRAPVVPVGSFADETGIVRAPPRTRLSAVLVALTDRLPGRSGPHVLVTRRSTHLRFHAGEVSFPGGRVEPGETPIEAALRESHEEIALDPSIVDVRGELPHLETLVSGSYIVPVVAEVPEPGPLVPNPSEVDAAYWVPVDTLTAPGVHHREIWTRNGQAAPIEFFELDDDIVWGATARVLVGLLAA